MPFYETFWWQAADAVTTVGYAVLLFANLLRKRCVPGTRARYRWASVCRAAIGPSYSTALISLTEGIASSSIADLLVALFALAFIVPAHRELNRDGDDDWFKRTGKRLRRWARSLSFGPSGALAGGMA